MWGRVWKFIAQLQIIKAKQHEDTPLLTQAPLTPITDFKYFTEKPQNGNRSSLFCKYGNREVKQAGPYNSGSLRTWNKYHHCSSSFRPPSFSVMYYISLKSTYWRILSLVFAPRTLLTFMQTLSCEGGLKRVIEN